MLARRLQVLIFTSSFAVLQNISVDSARAHFLRRTPLERAGGVGHILYRQADGLAGGGWGGRGLISMLMSQVNEMRGGLSSLRMSIVRASPDN